MDIKVGDYVRCGTAGIKRVVEIIKEPKFFKVSHIKDEEGLLINIGFITKVSESKIGVVETGDYVNGYLVLEVSLDGPCNSWIEIESSKDSSECTLWNNDIKEILTREQFQSRKYVFKEELEYGQE